MPFSCTGALRVGAVVAWEPYKRVYKSIQCYFSDTITWRHDAVEVWAFASPALRRRGSSLCHPAAQKRLGFQLVWFKSHRNLSKTYCRFPGDVRVPIGLHMAFKGDASLISGPTPGLAHEPQCRACAAGCRGLGTRCSRP